ncbi:paf acetylhydrolase family protein [Diplodia corticola]|uniref:1-alkyl-2-acetylglycerophosphocholine esterase n=1 Tax=Diplodia corticola TaxID=236234 RepID=A0A1J9QVT0_9PEZI|nr:paf acetylhydrolase family protein [Diplodia corticola]OJD32481.1 paf acetylhydrolase family protein [Diplodia corticola]
MLLKLQPAILLSLLAREATTLSLGKFMVSHSTSFLTDHARLDPFSPTPQPRSVAISTFTPVSNNCTTFTEIPYMPPATAAFESSKLTTAYGLPPNLFANLSYAVASAACTTDDHTTNGHILFSPALGTTRHFYNLVAATLASTTGAAVTTIDHPFDADVVERPNGTLIHGIDIPDASIPLALATRADDMRYVLSALSPPAASCRATERLRRPLAVGHSLGGAAALLAGARFAGAVNIDGSVVVGNASAFPVVERPVLFVAHEGKNLSTDATWEGVWPRLQGWKGLLELEGSQHYTFSDLPVLVEGMGLSETELEGVLGTIAGGVAVESFVGVVKAFWEMVRGKLDGEGFKEAVEEYSAIEKIL